MAWWLILLIVVLIIIVILIILKEKQLKEQLAKLRAVTKKTYEEEIDLLIRNENQETMLAEFEKIVKRYFREKAGFQFEFTYEELLKKLGEQENEEYLDFFNELSKLSYSQEKPAREEIIRLMNFFKFNILRKEKNKSIQKEVDKKNLVEELLKYEKYKGDMERFQKALEIRLKKGIISQDRHKKIIKKSLKSKSPEKWVKIYQKKINKIKSKLNK